jgi:xanthine dehydrogenase iron-sulfur cluster and FAD-binding subunit A
VPDGEGLLDPGHPGPDHHRQPELPISDVRGSAEYRGQLAENILLKFGRDLNGRLAAAMNGVKR